MDCVWIPPLLPVTKDVVLSILSGVSILDSFLGVLVFGSLCSPCLVTVEHLLAMGCVWITPLLPVAREGILSVLSGASLSDGVLGVMVSGFRRSPRLV